MNKILIELTLDTDGNFTQQELAVLKDTKRGKYLGKDDSGKMIYDQIPATVWLTDKGRFDTGILGEVKKDGNRFIITCLSEEATAHYKEKLKQAVINEFQTVCDRLEERKEKARVSLRKADTELVGANKALNQIKELLHKK